MTQLTMNESALLWFESDVDGHSAAVTVYRDRVEWARPEYAICAKIGLSTLAVLTLGLSLLVPPARPWHRGIRHTIPARSMHAISDHRTSPTQREIIISGGAFILTLRVPQHQADTIRAALARVSMGNTEFAA
ncbi:hypothetical protein F4553_007548 [Allocatelliglobosispora scoriae]|uniref:PH domain-containing protein n=1 Tax=Allocatelliglobosispora scoriae TaxID=643052 RepID=A0A841C169_9ACTN|nr:hypothetical protein [Allocatelliglobosispora scoriae]MBB5874114.1 hypothetical protein [Allocatelliglobosispora scoriae]